MKSLFTKITLCFSILLYAQNTNNDSFSSDYKAYFEVPRETLFTHLNKTTFIQGENLWFKTYAHDRHFDAISKATTNINVGIYNSKGKLIKDDLWLAANGAAVGNILIDSTFATGDYYIKASTNWMKNFKENDAFVQKIKVIANDNAIQVEDNIANNFDLQFLPEGGHLVSNAPNVVGFKILNKNGKGVEISGTIYDTKDNEITSFKSNEFGIGKFLLNPQPQETYRAEVVFKSSQVVRQIIKDVKNRGITLQVNNLNPKSLILSLNTNEETLAEISGRIFNLVLHKNGILKAIPFVFEAETTKSLIIPKTDLFTDMNIITVFDDTNQPILERLVFNDSFRVSKAKFNISKIRTEQDSLVFSIYELNEKSLDSVKAFNNVSISVLPTTSIAYDPDHNILSANYLRPYVKGSIESPSYYFEAIDNEKRYNLDLMLLTQGWSRYDWSDIFQDTQVKKYKFVNGMALQGRVISPKNITSLKLQSPQLMGNDWLNIDVNDDNTFLVENLYFLKNETIRISYIDEEGNYRKPSLSLVAFLEGEIENISEENLIQGNAELVDIKFEEKKYDQTFFYEDAEVLEEVLLTGNTKKKSTEPTGIISPDVNFKDNYIAVTKESIITYPRVLDIIRDNGYNAFVDQRGDVNITRFFKSSPSSNGKPLILFDGVPLNDFTILGNMRSNEIEGVSVDRTGLGYGVRGAEGVIKIYSRTTNLYDKSSKTDEFAFIGEADNGFAIPQEFYTPRYKSYTTDLFRNFGTIGWLPNVTLPSNTSQLFKLRDTKSEAINFYIEGYDSDGHLVSQKVTLKL